ncbi:hypothetical protein WN944_027124 [Citrus x changshan-huyou]|uniref:Serine carboxypeptidase n=1 Tax=Citrus x changshan-huyou TaxID=2935761 RepID=A0AAP0LGY5_9ROSI
MLAVKIWITGFAYPVIRIRVTARDMLAVKIRITGFAYPVIRIRVTARDMLAVKIWITGFAYPVIRIRVSGYPDSRDSKRHACCQNSGHYVPQLSKAIIRHNQATGEKAINLKGYMFWWSAGLISDDTYKQLNLLCDYESFVHPSCTASVSQSNRLLKRMHVVGHASEKYDPCTEKHSVVYFNQPEVQKALHVIPAVAPAKWETCSGVVNNNWLDSPRTVLDIYHELIHSGLRIWMFSGDTDVVIPITSTRYSIDGRMDPRVCRTYLCHREGSRPRSPIA